MNISQEICPPTPSERFNRVSRPTCAASVSAPLRRACRSEPLQRVRTAGVEAVTLWASQLIDFLFHVVVLFSCVPLLLSTSCSPVFLCSSPHLSNIPCSQRLSTCSSAPRYFSLSSVCVVLSSSRLSCLLAFIPSLPGPHELFCSHCIVLLKLSGLSLSPAF